MKKLVLGSLGGLIVLIVSSVVGLLILFRPPAPAEHRAEAFVLENITLIEPGRTRTPGARLSVAQGTLLLTNEDASDSSAEILSDYEGAFVLPGLVDMHSHLPPKNLLNTTGQYGALYLLHGVTSIRDAGDVDGTAMGAAREAIENNIPMPRVFSSGPFVTAGEPRWPNSLILNSPDDAIEAVRRIKADGHTWVKSYDNLTEPMIRALESAADAEGLGVLGHVPHALAYEEARLRDVQHFLGVPKPDTLLGDSIPNRIADWDSVDEDRMQEIVRVTLEHGIVNTPTLALSRGLQRYRDYAATLNDPVIGNLPPFYPEVVWSPEVGIPVYRTIDDPYLDRLDRATSKKLQLLKRLFDAGATLRLGTDQQQPFTVPGASLHEEIRTFVEAGIPVETVWKMASLDAGAALGPKGLGRLHDGAPADFLIYRKDPTADLKNLDSLEAVVVRGRLFTREALHDSVDRWNAHWRHPIRHQLSNALVRRVVDRIAADFDH